MDCGSFSKSCSICAFHFENRFESSIFSDLEVLLSDFGFFRHPLCMLFPLIIIPFVDHNFRKARLFSKLRSLGFIPHKRPVFLEFRLQNLQLPVLLRLVQRAAKFVLRALIVQGLVFRGAGLGGALTVFLEGDFGELVLGEFLGERVEEGEGLEAGLAVVGHRQGEVFGGLGEGLQGGEVLLEGLERPLGWLGVLVAPGCGRSEQAGREGLLVLLVLLLSECWDS